jgi:hypothetical protein
MQGVENGRALQRFAGCETALAEMVEGGELQPMEIGSGGEGEGKDAAKASRGLSFLFVSFFLLVLYYVAHLLGGGEARSRKTSYQRSQRTRAQRDHSKWALRKEDPKTIQTILGGKTVRVTPTEMNAVQQKQSHYITTIAFDDHNVCARMLHNPSMSRIPATRLPQEFFDHTIFYITASNPFLKSQKQNANVAANERLKVELQKMRPDKIYASLFGNTTVPSQENGFVVLFPLGSKERYSSSASGGGFGGEVGKEIEDKLTTMARHFGQATIKR